MRTCFKERYSKRERLVCVCTQDCALVVSKRERERERERECDRERESDREKDRDLRWREKQYDHYIDRKNG